MKLLLLLLIVPALGYSQIEIQNSPSVSTIGNVKSGGITIADISYQVANKDTAYTLKFRNQDFTTLVDYKTIVFNNEGNTLGSFYSILKSFFEDANRKNKDYKVDFELGKNIVLASNYHGSVMLNSSKGYVVLNEKQVDRLFGKN